MLLHGEGIIANTLRTRQIAGIEPKASGSLATSAAVATPQRCLRISQKPSPIVQTRSNAIPSPTSTIGSTVMYVSWMWTESGFIVVCLDQRAYSPDPASETNSLT